MCAVQFATILNTIHHRRVAMMNLADKMSLLECVQFCTVFVGNGEFPVLHGQAVNVLGRLKIAKLINSINDVKRNKCVLCLDS